MRLCAGTMRWSSTAMNFILCAYSKWHFFPRPLLVSGSPFLPPLSKRASLLKIRSPRPPAETPKFFYYCCCFFGFHYKNIVSWKFKHLGNPILGTQTFFHWIETKVKIFSALRAESKEKIAKNKIIPRPFLVPRPLLVSGSPFLLPLSKRASLLKILSPRPPAETPKICGCYCYYFFRISL